MKQIEHSYRTLEQLLNEEHIFLNPQVTFSMICSWLETDRRKMDDLLRKEVGMGGDELLQTLRSSVPKRLKRKYSINADSGPFF